MFIPGHWASAFINSLETQGAEAKDGIEALGILASWVRSLPGAVFGSSAAEKVEKQVGSDVKKRHFRRKWHFQGK